MTNRHTSKPILNIDDVELMDFGSPGGKFKAKLGWAQMKHIGRKDQTADYFDGENDDAR